MTAVFSPCRRWRYTLTREWIGGDGVCAFIGLNPSTADETQDDPTIRRCINYAKAWGFGGLLMLNLFAWRATDPQDMLAADEPVGALNDEYLRLIEDVPLAVAAWGTKGTHLNRERAVADRYRGRLHVLRLTSGGHPEHPLYLPKSLRATRWN